MILKKNSSKGLARLILSMVFVLCMVCSVVCSAGITASAATSSNSAVNSVCNSLVQVRMVYKTDSHDSGTPIQGGTGFLINKNTVLTCAHVVDVDDDVRSVCKNLYGDDFNEDNLSCEAVVSGDVTIPVTIRQESQDMDFAVLTLSEAMNVRTAAPLGDSSVVEKTQVVYALGFPEAVADMQNENTYTSSDVTITNGQVSKTSVSGSVNYIQHGAVLSAGNSGGPLVNESGQVVAINSGSNKSEENYYIAVSINQIKDVLDELGIEYTTTGSSSSSGTTAATAATEAEQTTTIAPTTQAATEASSTTAAAGTTDDGSDTTKMIIIIAIAALAVIIIVIVILIIVNSKKKSKKITPVAGTQNAQRGVPQGRPGTPYSGAPAQQYRPGGAVQSGAPQQYRPTAQGAAPTVPGDGSSETTVLGEGSGETSVLGYQPTGAVLVRTSTNERININKPEFTIGKERRRVDYCISGNGTVSRTHAKIVSRAGKCYISDLGSSNGTYVNGSKLTPHQEVALNNGDKIKLSDEEFRFMG